MRGLFLDLGRRRVGWAVFSGPEDAAPLFGTLKIDQVDMDDIAGITLPLRLFLRLMIQKHRPGVVAFESPWIPVDAENKNAQPAKGKPQRFRTSPAILRGQISLASEAETTAKECKVPHILEVASSSAKVALAGTARLGPDRRDLMVAAATNRGWDVADSDQAHAGGVGLVAYSSLGFDRDELGTPVPEPT